MISVKLTLLMDAFWSLCDSASGDTLLAINAGCFGSGRFEFSLFSIQITVDTLGLSFA